jgi:hypothetical protein
MHNSDNETFDMRFVNSSSMIVSGPTQSGKTTFVLNMIENKNELFKSAISKIYWICSSMPAIRKPNFQYIVGVPDDFDFLVKNSLVVLDDLMIESANNCAITNLFTKVSHHQNIFVIYITQNYFTQCKQSTNRRRNTQYLALFKNPADLSQIRILAGKMFPANPRFLTDVYADATRYPHAYLLIDLRQETDENLRVRTKILPHEIPMVTYKQRITK